MDRTLILVKPDAFARNLTGEIIARFERKGLRIAALRLMTLDRQTAEQHYAEHVGKPFFEELVSFITSGPLVAMVLEGEQAVAGGPPGDRRDQPARGHAGLDPRRLRDRGRPEHGPRLRLRRVGRARGRPVLPRAEQLRETLILASRVAAAAGDPRAGRPAVRRSRPTGVDELAEGEPRAVAAENARRKAQAVPRRARARRGHARGGRRRDPRQAARRRRRRSNTSAGSRAARTRWSAASPWCATGGSRRRRSRSPTCVFRDARRRRRSTAYVALGEWEGRAGGYAIQGARRGARPRRRRRLPERRRAAARPAARPSAAPWFAGGFRRRARGAGRGRT